MELDSSSVLKEICVERFYKKLFQEVFSYLYTAAPLERLERVAKLTAQSKQGVKIEGYRFIALGQEIPIEYCCSDFVSLAEADQIICKRKNSVNELAEVVQAAFSMCSFDYGIRKFF